MFLLIDPNNKKAIRRIIFLTYTTAIVLTFLAWQLIKISDSFLPVVFLVIVATLSRRSNGKYSPIRICFALIILVNLIIAPFVYVLALKNDLLSFTVDQQIVKNEQTSYLNDLIEARRKEHGDSLLKCIGTILSTHDKNLDLSSTFLEDNIIKVDTFAFSYQDSELGGGWLKIHGNTGKTLYALGGIKGFDKENMFLVLAKDNTLKNYLLKYRDYLDFHLEKAKIDKKQIWTYANVLPYVLDVYDTPNFKPVSRTAQIIHAIHVVIVFMFLISIFVTLSYEYLIKKLNKNPGQPLDSCDHL